MGFEQIVISKLARLLHIEHLFSLIFGVHSQLAKMSTRQQVCSVLVTLLDDLEILIKLPLRIGIFFDEDLLR